jgi:branched-chain amino acid transport system substrate-binding protein
MDNTELLSGMTRRDFLKTMAMAAVSTMAIPPLNVLADSPLRIGVLLPESTIYPDLGKNWLAGANLFLEQNDCYAAGRSISLIPESTGFTTGAVSRKVKRFINNKVKLVTGMISPDVAAGLQIYLAENRTFLIMSSLGANVWTPAIDSPYIYRHTLNTWEAAWAIGNWSATNLGHRAMIVSSFYESGFDSLLAFRLGFEECKGKILETIVTDAPIAGKDLLESALRKIRQKQPDVVYAAYCGRPAAEFIKAYASAGLAGKVPLIGTGMLVEKGFPGVRGLDALDITTGFAWSHDLPSPENRCFTNAFHRNTGRSADLFVLLGYETASLIVNALNICRGKYRDTEGFVRALYQVEFDSPRGCIKMNPATHTTNGPLYLLKVRSNGSGSGKRVLARLEDPTQINKRIDQLCTGTRSKWINVYLNV